MGRRTERNSVRPSYFNPNALLHLRAPDSGRRRNAIPRRPSYFNTNTLSHLRASESRSTRTECSSGTGCPNQTSSTVEVSRRDDPEGRPGRGITPRVVRIRSDGSVHLKPVEVHPLRHAFSWLSGLDNRTHAVAVDSCASSSQIDWILARAAGTAAGKTCPYSDRNVARMEVVTLIPYAYTRGRARVSCRAPVASNGWFIAVRKNVGA